MVLQIRFGNVQDDVPTFEAFFAKPLDILGKTESRQVQAEVTHQRCKLPGSQDLLSNIFVP